MFSVSRGSMTTRSTSLKRKISEFKNNTLHDNSDSHTRFEGCLSHHRTKTNPLENNKLPVIVKDKEPEPDYDSFDIFDGFDLGFESKSTVDSENENEKIDLPFVCAIESEDIPVLDDNIPCDRVDQIINDYPSESFLEKQRFHFIDNIFHHFSSKAITLVTHLQNLNATSYQISEMITRLLQSDSLDVKSFYNLFSAIRQLITATGRTDNINLTETEPTTPTIYPLSLKYFSELVLTDDPDFITTFLKSPQTSSPIYWKVSASDFKTVTSSHEHSKILMERTHLIIPNIIVPYVDLVPLVDDTKYWTHIFARLFQRTGNYFYSYDESSDEESCTVSFLQGNSCLLEQPHKLPPKFIHKLAILSHQKYPQNENCYILCNVLLFADVCCAILKEPQATISTVSSLCEDVFIELLVKYCDSERFMTKMLTLLFEGKPSVFHITNMDTLSQLCKKVLPRLHQHNYLKSAHFLLHWKQMAQNLKNSEKFTTFRLFQLLSANHDRTRVDSEAKSSKSVYETLIDFDIIIQHLSTTVESSCTQVGCNEL